MKLILDRHTVLSKCYPKPDKEATDICLDLENIPEYPTVEVAEMIKNDLHDAVIYYREKYPKLNITIKIKNCNRWMLTDYVFENTHMLLMS